MNDPQNECSPKPDSLSECSQIIESIRQGLCGDWEKDEAFLQASTEKYKEHPNGFEILREIGRLIYKSMPEDLKKDLVAAYDADLERMTKTLRLVEEEIKQGKIDEAEQLLLADELDEGFSESLFPEDQESVYLSFSNPLEQVYYQLKFKPGKTLREPGGIPFGPSYHLATYVAFDKQNFDKALRIIEKGLKRCPMNIDLMFERAEIYKVRKDMKNFRHYTDGLLPYLYRAVDIGKYFRNLGYYFVEAKDWDAAICTYAVSLLWDNTEIAGRELAYCGQASGRSFEEVKAQVNDMEKCNRILSMHSLAAFCVDPLWIQLAWYLGEQAEKSGEDLAAMQFYSVHYELSNSSESEIKIRECQARTENLRK